MKKSRREPVVLICRGIALSAAIVPALESFAQGLPTSLTVTEQYPRSASQAVLSESGSVTLHPGDDLAFVGLGGQVGVVKANGPASGNLSLWSGASTSIYVNGFVHDLAIVRDSATPARDRVYAAGGIGRVTSIDVSGAGGGLYNRQFADGGAAGDYVRSISALDVLDSTGAKQRVIFAGTRDSDTSGVIRVYQHTGEGANLLLRSTYATTPVYALTVSSALTSDNKITLLAGTACGGLLRFDIPQSVLAGTAFSLSSYLTNSWTPSGTTAFVRDIVINESHQVAFVACHSKGIFAFDVNGSGVLNPHTSPWPIQPNGIPPYGLPDERFDGLALSPDGKYLVAALGPPFMEEQQQWGTCAQKVACDGSVNVPSSTVAGRGLRVYEVDSGGAYASGWVLHTHYPTLDSGEALRPLAVSTRPGSGGKFFVDVPGDSSGFVIKEYDASISPRKFTSLEHEFAIFDQVLIGAVDDVSLHTIGNNTVLYSAYEKGLATFNVTGGALSLPFIVEKSAVILSVNDTWPTPYAVGGTDDGVALFNLSSPLAPVPLSGMFNTQGHGHIWVQGFATPSSVSPSAPLVYVVNKDEALSTLTDGPGVRMWDITSALSINIADSTRLKAVYVDENSFSGMPVHRTFGGIVVADLGTGFDHVIYVGYGPDKKFIDPSGPILATSNDKIGLVVLKMTWDPIVGPSIVRVAQGGALDVVAVSGLTGNEPLGRATRTGNEIYVAYGCYGVAKFDVGSPLAPTFVAHRPAPAGGSAIQAIRIGNQVFTSYLGVNYLTVEDAATFGTGTVSTPLRTHFQPINVIGATGGTSYYGADGRGGVIRFTVQ